MVHFLVNFAFYWWSDVICNIEKTYCCIELFIGVPGKKTVLNKVVAMPLLFTMLQFLLH